MKVVDFWRLERSVQERFVASSQGAAAPAALAIRPMARDARILGYAALGACALLAGLLALRFGFGDLGNRFALAPTWFIALYAGCFALSAFGFLKAAARYVSAFAVPYRPALYLFPIGVIDARSPQLVVHRISESTEARFDAARRCLRVELDGAAFEFPASDAARASEAAGAIIALRDKLESSGPASSAREQSLVDPLVDNGFKNPFSAPESLRKVLPWWVKVWPLLALILGVLLGGAAFRVRNHLSEARLYAAARQADDTATYRTYLARGGQNPDVSALLLPRTELRDAAAHGTVSAIEQFLVSHPNTRIQSEVDAVLHQALTKELAAAQALGTLSALKDFGVRYARYPFLTSELDRAVDARIEATLQRLKPTLAANQSRLLPFYERLLHYTAKHGPEVAVRFQRRPTETLEAAEKALRLSAYFTGEKALPGQYFAARYAEPREAAAAAVVVDTLSEHFPRDLVDARLAPAQDTGAESKATVPTLLITYHTEMSGAFTSRKPRLAVSGIGMISRATFEIPGDAEPLAFKLSVWRAPDLKAVTDSSTPAELPGGCAPDLEDHAARRTSARYLAA